MYQIRESAERAYQCVQEFEQNSPVMSRVLSKASMLSVYAQSHLFKTSACIGALFSAVAHCICVEQTSIKNVSLSLCVGVGAFTLAQKMIRRLTPMPLPVYGHYRERCDECVQETVSVCAATPLARLYQSFQTLPPHLLNFEGFWSAVSAMSMKRLIDQEIRLSALPLSKRFIYAISRERQLRGYLLGTIHEHSASTAWDAILHNTVEKCSTLITEIGKESLAFLKRPSGVMHFCMDAALVTKAQRCCIPIQALENLGAVTVMEDAFKRFDTVLQSLAPSIAALICTKMDQDQFSVQETYVRGDEQQLYQVSIPGEGTKEDDWTIHHAIFTQRNRRWMPHLLRELDASVNKGPICVAVGANHLFGENGLISLFEKEGFTVRREASS